MTTTKYNVDIIVAYDTVASHDEAGAFLPVFTASASCKKPEAIEKNIKEQEKKWMEGIWDNLYVASVFNCHLTVSIREAGTDKQTTEQFVRGASETTGEFAERLLEYVHDEVPACELGRVRWFGFTPKLLAKMLYVATAKEGLFVRGAGARLGDVASRLLHGADWFDVSNLISPSGINSLANQGEVLRLLAGSDGVLSDLAEKFVDGECKVQDELELMTRLISRFGLVNTTAHATAV